MHINTVKLINEAQRKKSEMAFFKWAKKKLIEWMENPWVNAESIYELIDVICCKAICSYTTTPKMLRLWNDLSILAKDECDDQIEKCEHDGLEDLLLDLQEAFDDITIVTDQFREA
tara:strand:+ start:2895 stop:3242 length:348 start_codon:yes stop_codon:yes gene_type:complete